MHAEIYLSAIKSTQKLIFIFLTIASRQASSNIYPDQAPDLSQIDLGAPVTRIFVKEEDGVFVGGVNFLAQLTSHLDLILRLSIGPVEEPEFCWPNKAPCENTVRVLLADKARNMLLVCGTAYQGTCTLHSLTYIWDYYCLYERPLSSPDAAKAKAMNPSPDILASTLQGYESPTFNTGDNKTDWKVQEQNDVPGFATHFLPIEAISLEGTWLALPTNSTASRDFPHCRSRFFLALSDEAPTASTTTFSPSVLAYPKFGRSKSNSPITSDFASRLFVAGKGLHGKSTGDGGQSPAPLLMSVREIRRSEQHTISYAGGPQPGEPRGFDLSQDMRDSDVFSQDFRLSFTHGNWTYMVFVERKICADGTLRVTTRVGSLCHNSPSLAQYVDIPISCMREEKEYTIMTSAILGTIGGSTSTATENTPVLLVAFGVPGVPQSHRVDPKQGSAVCAFTIDMLNKEMNMALMFCDAFAEPASWINGSKEKCEGKQGDSERECTTSPKNPYIQSNYYKVGTQVASFHDTAVGTMLSYTAMRYSEQFPVLSPAMKLYLLTLDGQMHFLELRMESKGNVVIDDAGMTVFSKLDLDLTTPTGAWNGQPVPVGDTDNIRAMIYVSNGNKILSLRLSFCERFRSCGECLNQRSRCRWCDAERMCRGDDSLTQCNTDDLRTCPPTINSFHPRTVPSAGGSVLTIYGSHLKSEAGEHGISYVEVCDNPCNVTNITENSIICVLLGCDSCPERCTVRAVTQHPNSAILSPSQLSYVTPNATQFSPSYGPIRGGTQVYIEGQHLDAGTYTSVKVAGTECKINDMRTSSNTLVCEMMPASDSELLCGEVEVTIDNYNAVVPGQQYCLKPDPVVTNIVPVKSIESGGITITVSGSNLDSATGGYLYFLHTYEQGDSGEIYTKAYKGECLAEQGSGGDVMRCVTPNVQEVGMFQDQQVFGNSGENDSVVIFADIHKNLGLRLELDGSDILAETKDDNGRLVYREMGIYRDPEFFVFAAKSKDAQVDVNNPEISIRGNHIPGWIPQSEIRINLGVSACPVLKVKPSTIVCDGSAAAEIVIQAMERLSTTISTKPKVKTTTTVPSTTTNPDYFTTSDGNSSSLISSTSAYKETDKNTTRPLNDPDQNISSTPSDFLSALKVKGRMKRMKRDANMNHHEATTTKPNRGFSMDFVVQIEIGNYKKNLGKVAIGNFPERPAPTSEPPDEEDSIEDLDVRALIGTGAGVAVMLLICSTFLICMFMKERRRNKEAEMMAPYYMGSFSGSGHGSREAAVPSLRHILESIVEPGKLPEVNSLIIKLDRLTIGKSIGSGNFGCVYEGLLTSTDGSTSTKVAVKTLQDSASQSLDLQGFVQEAVLMRDFKHPHVLGLVGLAEKADSQGLAPYVILPFMERGDLLSYVRDQSVSLSLHDVIRFGADIASGMAYLSALKFVHRDLAARNCMLDSQYRVKVADFGLCRDIYEKGYYTSDNRKKLPIRWMATESIEHGAYSTKTDVWSFGVVLWEMTCRGVTPYPGVDGWDIINFLRTRRLAPPFFCPDELYTLMMKCWAKDPETRPAFKVLHNELLALIGQIPPDAATPQIRRGSTINMDTKNTGATPNGLSSNPEPHNKGKGPVPAPRNTSPKMPALIGPIGRKSLKAKDAEAQKYRVTNDEENGKQEVPPYDNVWQSNNGGPSKSADLISVVVTTPVVKNVMITIPACYSHRDLSATTASEYIQLVDNYEPTPKFSNKLLKAKKARWSGKKTNRHERAKRGKHEPAQSLADQINQRSRKMNIYDDEPSVSSVDMSDFTDGRIPSIAYLQTNGGYFELDTARTRDSAANSDNTRGSGHSSGAVSSVANLSGRSSRASNAKSMDGASVVDDEISSCFDTEL